MEDLIRSSPIPMSDTLINLGFPTIALTITDTDDVSIIQVSNYRIDLSYNLFLRFVFYNMLNSCNMVL